MRKHPVVYRSVFYVIAEFKKRGKQELQGGIIDSNDSLRFITRHNKENKAECFQLHQTFLYGFGHCFNGAAYVQFLINFGYMTVDRCIRNLALVRDQFIT